MLVYLSERPVYNDFIAELDLSGASHINPGITLNGVNLQNADLSCACLATARLIKADLRNANLSSADLNNADLSNADLTGAVVSEEQLKSAKSLNYATMPNGEKYHSDFFSKIEK